jgi:hypothetical protein
MYKKSEVLITLIGPNRASFSFRMPIPNNQRLVDACDAGVIGATLNFMQSDTEYPDTFVDTSGFHDGIDSILGPKPEALKVLEKATGGTVSNWCTPIGEQAAKRERRKKHKKKKKFSGQQFPENLYKRGKS